jgi:hypothetical protein
LGNYQVVSNPTNGDLTPSKIPSHPISEDSKILEEGNQEESSEESEFRSLTNHHNKESSKGDPIEIEEKLKQIGIRS